MLYEQLKKIIIYHLIAGIVFSFVLFTAIALNKYEDSVLNGISKNMSIKTKIIKMRQARADMESEIKHMKSEIKYMESVLLSDFTSMAPEEFISMALDDIKANLLPWTQLRVGNIEEEDSEVYVSVEMTIPVYDYTTLLNYIGYLESLKFPYYTIKNVTMTKLQDQPEEVICDIRGILRMPILSKGIKE